MTRTKFFFDRAQVLLVLAVVIVVVFFVGRRVLKAKQCEDKGGVYVVVNDVTQPAFDACIIAKRVD